jgi:hypothetical protein
MNKKRNLLGEAYRTHGVNKKLVTEFCGFQGALHIFRAEDGDSIFLRNAGIYIQVYNVLQPRRPTLTN